MTIRIHCAHCGAFVHAHDKAAGREVKCPLCQVPLRVPSTEPPRAEGIRPPRSSGSSQPALAITHEDGDDLPPQVKRSRFPWVALTLAASILLLGLTAVGMGVVFFVDAARQAELAAERAAGAQLAARRMQGLRAPPGEAVHAEGDVLELKNLARSLRFPQLEVDDAVQNTNRADTNLQLARETHHAQLLNLARNGRDEREAQAEIKQLTEKQKEELAALGAKLKHWNEELGRRKEKFAKLKAEALAQGQAILDRHPGWRVDPPGDAREPLRQLGLLP